MSQPRLELIFLEEECTAATTPYISHRIKSRRPAPVQRKRSARLCAKKRRETGFTRDADLTINRAAHSPRNFQDRPGALANPLIRKLLAKSFMRLRGRSRMLRCVEQLSRRCSRLNVRQVDSPRSVYRRVGTPVSKYRTL